MKRKFYTDLIDVEQRRVFSINILLAEREDEGSSDLVQSEQNQTFSKELAKVARFKEQGGFYRPVCGLLHKANG